MERLLVALLAVALVPLSGWGQQSGSGEEKKKTETASRPSELTNVETTEERKEELDRELDSSLSEFDALILREQEILERRREEAAAAGGGGGAGTAEVGSGRGTGEGEGDGEDAGEEKEKTAEASGTGGSKDDPEGEEVASEEGTPEESGEIPNGRVPSDVGDGRDDDIVARQLREAAMKEEDPELREKLWDEYRAYKFGEKKKETGE